MTQTQYEKALSLFLKVKRIEATIMFMTALMSFSFFTLFYKNERFIASYIMLGLVVITSVLFSQKFNITGKEEKYQKTIKEMEEILKAGDGE